MLKDASVFRFYLRLALLPIILLTAVLLVIRSQPYDDHELRELLLPDDCPAPCFMGIQPGVTTVEEAVAILEASEWVEDVKNETVAIYWRWANLKPNWIDAQRGGHINIRVNTNLVDNIVLYTNISIGEVHLIFGKPDMEIVGIPQGNIEQFILYFANYQDGLVMQTWLSCELFEPFKSPIEIVIAEETGNLTGHFNSLNDIFRVC